VPSLTPPFRLIEANVKLVKNPSVISCRFGKPLGLVVIEQHSEFFIEHVTAGSAYDKTDRHCYNSHFQSQGYAAQINFEKLSQ
jgi:hypothetical protein